MPVTSRWRPAYHGSVSGAPGSSWQAPRCLIGGLTTLAEEDSFSDIPSFSGVVKPVASEWLPTATVDEFGGVMAKLKEQVDDMAKQ